MAWDYPFFIIATLFAALGVAGAIIRAAQPGRKPPDFECAVCGRKQRGVTPREWRYCPYCGVPRDAKSLREMPRQRRSVVDL